MRYLRRCYTSWCYFILENVILCNWRDRGWTLLGGVTCIFDGPPILPWWDLSQRSFGWRRIFEGILLLNIIDLSEGGILSDRFVTDMAIFCNVNGEDKNVGK